jgi:hypothetical protein
MHFGIDFYTWECGKGQRIDLTGRTGKYLRLNAEGRRISESRMRENRTYGLMRGRWQPHCSTLSRVERLKNKKAIN